MKRILVLLFSLVCCTLSFAQPFKEFIVIGDSLSDNGNLYAKLLKIIPKSPPYYNGRFSNGPTWAEDVGKYYVDKYNIPYKIIAYGGATAIVHNPIHDKFVSPISLDGEMFEYIMGSLFTNKSNTLYAMWIGANDYLYDEQPDKTKLVNDVVNKIASSIKTLISLGAKNIVVMNLPDLARTPYARSHHTAERLHELTLMHNRTLADAVAELKKANPAVKFTSIDVFSSFNDLLDHAEVFNQTYNVNLTDMMEACWKGGMTFNLADKKALDNDLQKTLTND